LYVRLRPAGRRHPARPWWLVPRHSKLGLGVGYPAGRLDEMIEDADAEGELTMPRVVIIHPEMVAKIELLVEADEARRGHLLGFRLQDDGE
jgi:hypothetical protein